MTGTFGRERAPERACLKRHEWPEEDRQIWEAALKPATSLLRGPGGARSSYRSVSNAKCEKGYGRFLTYLKTTYPDRLNLPPADRIPPEIVEAYIEHLEALGNSTQTLLGRLQELYEAAVVMAPKRDWSWIRRMASVIRSRHIPARDKRPKLVGTDRLVSLGFELMAQAEAQPDEEKAAVLFRDGLLIALLALRSAMRRRNIADFHVGRNLKRIRDTWMIVFVDNETKTDVHVEMPWPEALLSALEAWLNRWRPALLTCRGRWYRPPGDALWISNHGSAMVEQSLYDRISRRTCEALGVRVSPHLFRDNAASTIAHADPSHIGIAPDVLGHRSPATTEKYYTHAKMVEASHKMQQSLLDLRHSLEE